MGIVSDINLNFFPCRQMIGVALMFGIPYFGKNLTVEEKQRSKCNVPGSTTNIQAKDLTNGLIFMSAVLTVVVVLFVALFKADYKRMHAESEKIVNAGSTEQIDQT